MSRTIITLICLLLGIQLYAQNTANLMQSGNYSKAQVVQNGGNNLLVGIPGMNTLVEDANGDLQSAAYQMSEAGDANYLMVNQTNGLNNEIQLYQKASYNNEAFLDQQAGNNTIILKETSLGGSNKTHITQLNGTGYVNLERDAFLDNVVPSSDNTIMNNPAQLSGIYQNGFGNMIFGSTIYLGQVIPDPGIPAKQISEAGSNWMEIWQNGSSNVVGLYQKAHLDNTALIKQENNGNLAAIYQESGGFNYLFLEQTGNMKAYIYQSSASGTYNTAVVKQY